MPAVNALPDLTVFARTTILGGLSALAGIVALKLFTGAINSGHLLHERIGAEYRTSAHNVQLFLATITVAAIYLGDSFRLAHDGHVPDVDPAWLVVLGASESVYVARSALSTLRGRAR